MPRNLQINIRIGLQQVQQAIGALSRRFNLLRSSLRAVFRTGVVAGFFAALRSGVRVVSGLQNAIKQLGSEFLQLRLKATETAAIITKGGMGFTSVFEEALAMSRDLSTQIGFSAMQIQEGMITAARSGLQLQESLTITGTAMQLATAHGEEFQSTLNNLIGVTRAFGVELTNIPAFADALTTAVTESNVSLDGLFEGLKNVASVASTAFGETRETIVDTTAALMTLNDAGIQNQKAGTRLRAAFQKLLGGTAKTTAAFTKYGVNLFKSNAESQRFLGTLLNGQRAMANTEEALNKLKNKQFELVIAGKENSDEYMNLQDDLDALNGKLGSLEDGLDNVYRQFTLAGGKLKPFSDILGEIGQKAPAEVIGRAFGIRGGEAIMRLLKDVDKFKKFKTSIEEYVAASEKGQSITQDMYARFLDTVLVGWMKIRNTALAILGEIADGFFEALKPVLGPIQSTLDQIFTSIRQNKDSFKKIFAGVAELLRPELAALQAWATLFSASMKNVFTPGKSAILPDVRRNEDGTVSVGVKSVEGSVAEKIRAMLQSVGDIIVATLESGLRKLEPIFTYLATIFSDALAAAFQVKAKMWENIGVLIAGAMVKPLIVGLQKELPSILRTVGDLLKNLGVPSKLKIKGPFGLNFSVPLPNQQTFENAATKLEGGNTQNRNTSVAGKPSAMEAVGGFLDKILGVGKSAEESGKKVEQIGRAFVNLGNGVQEIDLSILNNSGQMMSTAGKEIKKTGQIVETGLISMKNDIVSTNNQLAAVNRRLFLLSKKASA